VLVLYTKCVFWRGKKAIMDAISLWRRGDPRHKMHARWTCAVLCLTYTIPHRDSSASTAPRGKKTDVCISWKSVFKRSDDVWTAGWFIAISWNLTFRRTRVWRREGRLVGDVSSEDRVVVTMREASVSEICQLYHHKSHQCSSGIELGLSHCSCSWWRCRDKSLISLCVLFFFIPNYRYTF
jgi:hypothetical protein